MPYIPRKERQHIRQTRREAIRRLLAAGATLDAEDLAAAYGVKTGTIYGDIAAIRQYD